MLSDCDWSVLMLSRSVEVSAASKSVERADDAVLLLGPGLVQAEEGLAALALPLALVADDRVGHRPGEPVEVALGVGHHARGP